MLVTFKAFGMKSWTIDGDIIIYGNKRIPLSAVHKVTVSDAPASSIQNGVIQLSVGSWFYTLAYPFSQREEAAKVAKYIQENAGKETANCDSNGIADTNSDKLVTDSKKSSIKTLRIVALLSLVMNIITICLGIGNFAIGYTTLLTAVVCAVAALYAVILSLSVNKHSKADDIDRLSNQVFKIVVGVIIFSAIDFFVAINHTLFWG